MNNEIRVQSIIHIRHKKMNKKIIEDLVVSANVPLLSNQYNVFLSYRFKFIIQSIF